MMPEIQPRKIRDTLIFVADFFFTSLLKHLGTRLLFPRNTYAQGLDRSDQRLRPSQLNPIKSKESHACHAQQEHYY
jgi:hypothetical protein